MLEWVVPSYSRNLTSPGIESVSPALANSFFTSVPPGKPDSVIPIHISILFQLHFKVLQMSIQWLGKKNNIPQETQLPARVTHKEELN